MEGLGLHRPFGVRDRPIPSTQSSCPHLEGASLAFRNRSIRVAFSGLFGDVATSYSGAARRPTRRFPVGAARLGLSYGSPRGALTVLRSYVPARLRGAVLSAAGGLTPGAFGSSRQVTSPPPQISVDKLHRNTLCFSLKPQISMKLTIDAKLRF